MPQFEPYREWLGIESEGKPTYYQLLGVSPQETHAETIHERASQQLAILEQQVGTEHESARRRLIDRVRRAERCLSDAALREEYRYKLHRTKQTQRKQADLSKPTAAEPKRTEARENTKTEPKHNTVSSTPNVGSPHAETRTNFAKKRSHQQRHNRAVLFSFVLLCVSFIGILYLLLTQTDVGGQLVQLPFKTKPADSVRDKAPAVIPTAPGTSEGPGDSTRRPSDIPPTADGNDVKQTPSTGPGVIEPDPVLAPPEPQVTAEQLQSLSKLLQGIKPALGRRDFKASEKLLADAKALASRPQDKDKLNRLAVLHEYVESYWSGLSKQLARLDGGSEIEFPNGRAIVVEKTRDELIVRHNGANKTFDLADLPIKFAVHLADSWFDANAASTNVFRGAMLAVTPGYSAESAREIWRSVDSSGEVSLGDLELVLDDDYDLQP